jgi:hypothetical protein
MPCLKPKKVGAILSKWLRDTLQQAFDRLNKCFYVVSSRGAGKSFPPVAFRESTFRSAWRRV